MSIGIDACNKETCTMGFCYNDIQPQRTYSVVSDDNGIVPAPASSKTFISMNMRVIAMCVTEPLIPKACSSYPCLNGGTCIDVFPSGYMCKCLKGFTGPQCQLTTRFVKGPNGWFWLTPLTYFFEGSIEFEFATKDLNGLILYQGPFTVCK